MSTNQPAPGHATTQLGKAVWICLLAPVIAAGIAVWKYRAAFGTKPSSSQEIWGQFGDFLGGIVNPVVGLVTIVLLILTLRSQQDELREQRAELKEQRVQMGKQAFEQTFFAWTTTLHKSIENCRGKITRHGELVYLRGTELLAHVVAWSPADQSRLNERIDRINAADSEKDRDQAREELAQFAEVYAVKRQVATGANFATVFRMLAELLKFVHGHESLTPIERKRYVDLLRASLDGPVLQYYFLRGAQNRRKVETHAIVGQYSFLYFLSPREADMHIQAMLHYGAHCFPITSFDQDTITRAAQLIASSQTIPELPQTQHVDDD